MGALHVYCTDAFLQSQKTLINLSSFNSSLSIVTLRVLCPFGASQIYKQKLSQSLDSAHVLDGHTADGVRSTPSVICNCLMRGSHTVSIVNDVEHFLI